MASLGSLPVECLHAIMTMVDPSAFNALGRTSRHLNHASWAPFIQAHHIATIASSPEHLYKSIIPMRALEHLMATGRCDIKTRKLALVHAGRNGRVDLISAWTTHGDAHLVTYALLGAILTTNPALAIALSAHSECLLSEAFDVVLGWPDFDAALSLLQTFPGWQHTMDGHVATRKLLVHATRYGRVDVVKRLVNMPHFVIDRDSLMHVWRHCLSIGNRQIPLILVRRGLLSPNFL